MKKGLSINDIMKYFFGKFYKEKNIKFVLHYKNYRKILYGEFKNYRNFISFTYGMLNYRAIIYEDGTEIIEYGYIDDIYDKYDKEIKSGEVIKIEICM